MMKHILLFGAGKSATELIYYLNSLANNNYCRVTIADAQMSFIKNRLSNCVNINFLEIDIFQDDFRKNLIKESDVVISLMPPNLHYIIALDCINYKKSLLTASYIDPQIQQKKIAIEEAGVLFLYEMGLDPGIDHMSAMEIIDTIHEQGGVIKSFQSHCGGLVAPEFNNNPWNYKITWNPRNIILAGKAGAIFKQHGEIIQLSYEQLFSECPQVFINKELGNLSYYYNRDSLQYIKAYGLEETDTFIRTTLRFPSFCEGWNWIVQLQLTDDNHLYNTENLTAVRFFNEHIQQFELEQKYQSIPEVIKLQLTFLFSDDNLLINNGLLTATSILQIIVEKKLQLNKGDKDMIVMLHEFEYELNHERYYIKSNLIVKGEDELRTAMSKTVGLPLGITAKLLIEDKIQLKGLHIPTHKEIYKPVLELLKEENIRFEETKMKIQTNVEL